MDKSMARPLVTSHDDLHVGGLSFNGVYRYHSFYYIDAQDDKVWYGKIKKQNEFDMPTVQEINDRLQLLEDASMYPEIQPSIRIAPSTMQGTWLKRPDFDAVDHMGTDFVLRTMLHEISIMEKLTSHPNIVKYYGCRVQRGRITGIVLELLEVTLEHWKPESIDIPAFMGELQSAVDHLHTLGLAHNDIKPSNIMIKEGRPILIDFGGCAPPGELVDYCGTTGWCEENFFRSETQHDVYSMNKLREWLENGRQM